MKKFVVLLALSLASTPLLAHNVSWNPNPMILDLAVSKLGVLNVTHFGILLVLGMRQDRL